MKMEIKNKLDELGLNSNNAVVIGSGILSALNLRESKDIDVVATKEKYKELFGNNRFHKEQNHGREILADDPRGSGGRREFRRARAFRRSEAEAVSFPQRNFAQSLEYPT
jgi:hypothetical protein